MLASLELKDDVLLSIQYKAIFLFFFSNFSINSNSRDFEAFQAEQLHSRVINQ